MKWYDPIKMPFKYCSLEKNRTLLWAFFTIIIGLTGVCMNIWSHYGPGCDLIDSIKMELKANKIGFVSPERRYEAPTVARPPQM